MGPFFVVENKLEKLGAVTLRMQVSFGDSEKLSNLPEVTQQKRFTKVASEARREQVWSPRPSCELSVSPAPHSWGTRSVAVGPPASLRNLVLKERLGVCSSASIVLGVRW